MVPEHFVFVMANMMVEDRYLYISGGLKPMSIEVSVLLSSPSTNSNLPWTK